jgi:hypothetical protein
VRAEDLSHPVIEINDQPQLVSAVPSGHLLPVAHHRQEHGRHVTQCLVQHQPDNHAASSGGTGHGIGSPGSFIGDSVGDVSHVLIPDPGWQRVG